MRKLMFSLLAGAAGVLGATSAQATVIICGGSGQPNCPNTGTDNVLLNSGTGTSVTGTTQSGALVTYTANGESLTANPSGQATVGATDTTTTYLNLDFAGGFTYAEFNISPFAGNRAGETTSVTITYYIGSVAQTVTVDTNGENRFGIYDDGGAIFNRLTFESVPNDTSFVDLRQLRIQEGVTTTAVPEPGTWAMMLLGFGAVGFGMRRRRRSLDHAMQIA